MYHPLGSRSRKTDRAVYLSDATFDLWQETRRRARLLADRSCEANADAVLRRACGLLLRQMARDAEKRGVDLSRPRLTDDTPEESGGFDGVPRPASD